MTLMTFFNIGNISISSVWLAVILALILTSFIYWGIAKKKLGDWYWNSFFYYFLVWKLSYIPLNFELFLDMPLSIAYFHGGKFGHFLGLAAISIYLFLLGKSRFSLTFTNLALIFFLYFSSYHVIINGLHGNYLEFILQAAILGGIIFLFPYLKKKEIWLSVQLFILIVLLKIFINSIFDSILSLESLSFIWMGITVLLLSIGRRLEDID